jgi:hypothetical protein
MSRRSTRRYKKGAYRKTYKCKGKSKKCKRKITKKRVPKMRAVVRRIPNKNETLVVFKNVPSSIVKKVLKQIKNKQVGGAGGPLGVVTTGISMVYGFGGGMLASLVIGASVATILSALNSVKITVDEEEDLLHKKSEAEKNCKFKDEITGRCLAPMVGTTQQRRMERSQAEVERLAKDKRELEAAGRDMMVGLGGAGIKQ